VATSVCLRCDWQGEVESGPCPRCGAPRYRAAERPPDGAASATRPLPDADPDARPDPRRDVGGPAFVDDASPKTSSSAYPRRSRGFAVSFVAAIVAAAVAFTWVRAHTPATPPVPRRSQEGTIVYASDLGDGTSRLWRWDLATGETQLGPRVRDPVELVNADTADDGWVGVTSRTGSSVLVGSVLRAMTPDAHADPLVRGDIVAWGPGGVDVVAVGRTPIGGGCRRHVTIDKAELLPETHARLFEADLCGDVLSVGRGGILTFFTIQRRDRVAIDYVGVGRPHRVLPGYAMIGASPLGDLLVVPGSDLLQFTVAPFGTRLDPDRPPTGVFGTALFFRGLAIAPIPYGEDADRFQIGRVMAWTPDGLTALVAGSLGDQAGMFEVDGGPGGGLRPPRFVGRLEGLTWATYAADGTAYVSSDAGISAVVDGRLVPLELPETAATPTGPIVWIR
jgi:hypothetical protein